MDGLAGGEGKDWLLWQFDGIVQRQVEDKGPVNKEPEGRK